jgi:nitroreductase
MIDTDSDRALQAVHGRRSIPKVRRERPPREMIERIIEAAGQAPNHHRTEPWRFIVLAGRARHLLGDVMADSVRSDLSDPDSAEGQAQIEKARGKPLRAPVIIVVAAVPSDAPKVIEMEEIAATAAATENMLIAAHALGLGAMWRTGRPAYDPAVKRFLGLPERAHIIAFVYVGYSDLPELPPRDRDTLQRAEWRGWNEDG